MQFISSELITDVFFKTLMSGKEATEKADLLVVERAVLKQLGLAEVSVFPVPTAGGALAAQGMLQFVEPAVVEELQADAGLDIGNTLIGMHLKRVAVPLRLKNNRIGETNVVAARTRPKLIGGCRAVYNRPADGLDK